MNEITISRAVYDGLQQL